MKIDGRVQRSNKTKDKLLKAAMGVFMEEGYQNTTMKKINQVAKTGHGTIYVHFPGGKDEIFAHLITEVMQEFYEIADIEFTPRNRDNAFEVIRGQVHQFISLAEKHKRMLMVLSQGIGVSSMLENKWKSFLNQFISRIARDIQYSQSQNLAKNHVNSEVAARVLLFTGERFIWEIVNEQNELSIEEIADNITTVYMFGLY